MSTFTWSPAPEPTENEAPRVRSAPFGDGYSQRVGDGINNSPRTWSLRFTRETADIQAIISFLRARGAAESFDWTPPDGPAGKWICKSWSRIVHHRVVMGVNATFEEVFGD
jgi:phage-related protein